MNTNDHDLIKRAMANPRGADANRLFQHYRPDVLKYIYYIVGSKERADDLCQASLIKALTNLPHFRFECSFRTWLFQIARNTTIDSFRRDRRERDHANSIADEELIESGMTQQMEAREMLQKYQKALNAMDQEHREVLILYELNSYSYVEISEITGVPVGTVKSRIARAREQVMELLKLVEQNQPPVRLISKRNVSGGGNI